MKNNLTYLNKICVYEHFSKTGNTAEAPNVITVKRPATTNSVTHNSNTDDLDLYGNFNNLSTEIIQILIQPFSANK